MSTAAPNPLGQAVAAEVRAEMARQRKTGKELAAVLQTSQQSASRRMTGEKPLDLDELGKIADWLEVPYSSLLASFEKAAS